MTGANGSDYTGYGFYGQDETTTAAAPTSWQLPPQPQPAAPAEMVPYHNYSYGYLPLPNHPNAVPSLVLGIIGLFIPPLSILALVLAVRGRNQLRTEPGVFGGQENLTAGVVLGGIGTALFVVYLLMALGIFALVFAIA